MLEEELQELNEKNRSIRNLKTSLFSLGLLILSGFIFYIFIDSIHPGLNVIFLWSLLVLFYGSMILAGVVAIVALRRTITSLKTYACSRNYFALIISILVLLDICNEIYRRL